MGFRQSSDLGVFPLRKAMQRLVPFSENMGYVSNRDDLLLKKHFYLLAMLETIVLFNIFCVIFLSGFFDE